MEQFLSGATMLAYLVSGLFFLRFWKDSKDRLFAIFALAFFVLAANRLVFALITVKNEARSSFYLIRLVAFILILIAILDKNRSGK